VGSQGGRERVDILLLRRFIEWYAHRGTIVFSRSSLSNVCKFSMNVIELPGLYHVGSVQLHRLSLVLLPRTNARENKLLKLNVNRILLILSCDNISCLQSNHREKKVKHTQFSDFLIVCCRCTYFCPEPIHRKKNVDSIHLFLSWRCAMCKCVNCHATSWA
jgi:hypothetical protein